MIRLIPRESLKQELCLRATLIYGDNKSGRGGTENVKPLA